jgi:hypothetical protein
VSGEVTPESIGRVVRHARLRDWYALLSADGLTRNGLVMLRGMLADARDLGPEGQALLLLTIERLAPLRNIRPEDDHLWQEIVGQVPDTPRSITHPPLW